MTKCVSNSDKEPNDMRRKLMKSFVVLLSVPSAMFADIDVADRLICDDKPNISSLGKFLVSEYIKIARSIPFCHTMRSL